MSKHWRLTVHNSFLFLNHLCVTLENVEIKKFLAHAIITEEFLFPSGGPGVTSVGAPTQRHLCRIAKPFSLYSRPTVSRFLGDIGPVNFMMKSDNIVTEPQVEARIGS